MGKAQRRVAAMTFTFKLVALRREHEAAYQRGVEIVLRLAREARARRQREQVVGMPR